MPLILRYLLAFVLFSLIFTGLYLHSQKFGPKQAFHQAKGDLNQVAALTASHYPPNRDCDLIKEAEQRALVHAFHSLEQLTQGPFEPLIERSIIWLSARLNLQAPDLSLGRGQVRVSSALKSEQSPPVSPTKEKWNQTAFALLQPCFNQQATRQLLSYYADQAGINFDKSLSREQIAALARFYNGQSIEDDIRAKRHTLSKEKLAAHISGEFYSHLLFALYIHYRFDQLNQKNHYKGDVNARS